MEIIVKKKRFLLDFEIETNASIEESAKTKQILNLADNVEIHFPNLATDPGTERPLLSCQVIIHADEFMDARDKGSNYLNEYLRVLAFTTNCSYEIFQLRRIVDWTIDVRDREFHIFGDASSMSLPNELLNDELFESSQHFMRLGSDSKIKKALRWFSLGVRSKFSDEQFQSFWFVLEIIAQYEKNTDAIPDLCPRCQTPLYCEKCQSKPTHRPYAKQAIQQLIDRIAGKNAADFRDQLFDIRNRLLHGESIEETMNMNDNAFSLIVDKLGILSWNAIADHMKVGSNEGISKTKLSVLKTNRYAHDKLTAIANASYQCSNPSDPLYKDIPSPSF